MVRPVSRRGEPLVHAAIYGEVGRDAAKKPCCRDMVRRDFVRWQSDTSPVFEIRYHVDASTDCSEAGAFLRHDASFGAGRAGGYAYRLPRQ